MGMQYGNSKDPDALTQILPRPKKMDPFPTNGTPSRDDLIELIKAQLDDDARDRDLSRDVFLCLAVTIPPRQRARIRDAVRPLLATARLRGAGRDSASTPDEDLHADPNDPDIAAELEAGIGVLSTLVVLGCQYFSVPSPLRSNPDSLFC